MKSSGSCLEGSSRPKTEHGKGSHPCRKDCFFSNIVACYKRKDKKVTSGLKLVPSSM